MNLYRRLGHANGTPEALHLAERLTTWHDAMVAHERRSESQCSDDCPHTDAQLLWREALDVFGPAAHELQFLATRAGDAPPSMQPIELRA
jgi:hypothetical protein